LGVLLPAGGVFDGVERHLIHYRVRDYYHYQVAEAQGRHLRTYGDIQITSLSWAVEPSGGPGQAGTLGFIHLYRNTPLIGGTYTRVGGVEDLLPLESSIDAVLDPPNKPLLQAYPFIEGGVYKENLLPYGLYLNVDDVLTITLANTASEVGEVIVGFRALY
jgi:hypothetical protein